MSGLCSKHQHYVKDCEACNAKHGSGKLEELAAQMKLSEVFGMYPISEGTIVSGLNNGRECDAYIDGFNKAIRKIDQREIDVYKLAELLRNERGGHQEFPPAEWDVRLAQHLSDNMKMWIKVKK